MPGSGEKSPSEPPTAPAPYTTNLTRRPYLFTEGGWTGTMGPMPDGGVTLARARHFVAQLDFASAQRLLGEALSGAHQEPSEAQAWEADLAAVYAGVLLQLNDAEAAGSWAGYSYTAMRRLHGERDRRTLHALGVLAVTQQRCGALDRASRSYQQLVAALASVDGPDGDRTLAAKADSAVVDHALGRCAQARATLAQVIAAYKARNGPAHPVGIKMTARLGGLWRDCGDFDQAQELLAQARSQAFALEVDDETHRVVSAIAETPMNREHRCGAATVAELGPQDFLPRPRVEVKVPEVVEWPEDEILDATPNQTPGLVPPPVPPSPVPRVVLPPPRLAPPPVPAPAPPARKPGRSGVIGVAAVSVLAAVATALVAVAVLASGKDAPPASASSPTAGAASPPRPVAPASGPVTDLRLTDEGDSIVATWVYPADARGPVIVSAATAGEPMRPMQSLPAGAQTYTLPGLDPKRDYCLAVTVVYGPEHTVMSQPVCTERATR